MKRFLPVGLIRSPITLGWSMVTQFTAEQAMLTRLTVRTFLSFPERAVFTALIWSGVVPQHPPNMVTPASASFMALAAKSSGSTLYSLVTGSGSPAFGFAITGSEVREHILSRTGKSSSGPREQLTPIASAPIPSSTATMHSGETPVKVRIFDSKVIVTRTGLSEFSLAARTAALTS